MSDFKDVNPVQQGHLAAKEHAATPNQPNPRSKAATASLGLKCDGDTPRVKTSLLLASALAEALSALGDGPAEGLAGLAVAAAGAAFIA